MPFADQKITCEHILGAEGYNGSILHEGQTSHKATRHVVERGLVSNGCKATQLFSTNRNVESLNHKSDWMTESRDRRTRSK